MDLTEQVGIFSDAMRRVSVRAAVLYGGRGSAFVRTGAMPGRMQIEVRKWDGRWYLDAAGEWSWGWPCALAIRIEPPRLEDMKMDQRDIFEI
jgi:hypothetical protein